MRPRMLMTIGALTLTGAGVVAQTAAPNEENYYAAGERVDLRAPVTGDAVIAGRLVTIGQPVGGDVLAAGWRVAITAPAADDVRTAGAELRINSTIDGDLTAAGGDVDVASGTRVAGRTWLSGGTVRADGIFEREVRIAGNTVQIGGEIRQPITVIAESLEVRPGARILAPLTYEGATEPRIAADATVAHPVTYKNIKASDARAARWPRGVSSVVFAVHVFIGGLLLLLVVPRLAAQPAEALRAEPGQSLLAGLLLVVTIPFVALLLMVSVVGLAAGLALGAVYAAVLFAGVVTAALFVGGVEGRLLKAAPPVGRARQAVYLLGGVITLAVLRSLPVIGAVVVFVSIVFGVGALGVWLYRAYLRTPSLAAA